MTREELQRLYSECVSRAFRAEQLAGLVRGVERFLSQPDPTVEIAYLKAKLADVEAERDQAGVKALREAAKVDQLTALASPRKVEAIASLVKSSTALVQIERDDARARAEVAEAEVERLARWKAEALPVITGLQELGAALGIPLGKRITGPDALEAVKALTARAEAAEQAVQRVRDMPATPPSGGYYMVSMREVLSALDGGAS